MIKVYENGKQLIDENRDFLNTDKYLSPFFFLDAPLLEQADKINYALSTRQGDALLLAVKVEPYNLLLFGEECCVKEMFDFLVGNGYELKGMLGSEIVCDAATEYLRVKHGIDYYEALSMDFMETTQWTEPSCESVSIPTEEDADEIIICLNRFLKDCGLADKINPDHVIKSLTSFRIIREKGKIISMAKAVPFGEGTMKIADVYTRDEYRQKGYARKVVNTIKNDILQAGKTATLNVDKMNPISNKLYADLGFKRVFSQGEYRRK